MANISKYTFSEVEARLDAIQINQSTGGFLVEGMASEQYINDKIEEIQFSCTDKQYSDDFSFVQPMYNDIHVIPDKHNTGVDETTCTLTVETNVVTEYGIIFRSDDGTTIKIDFNKSPNKTLDGEVIIENVNFANYVGSGFLNTYGYSGNGIVIKFKNCNFVNFVDSNHTNELVKAEFENCSFTRYNGSFATFNKCYFGGGDLNGDPMNPGTDCTFNNCYCSNIMQKTEEQGEGHIDGMQSLGCKRLYFNNCRWEVPTINYSITAGGMNVAIFVQPSDFAENVILDHCYVNGGGFYTFSCTGVDAGKCTNVKIIEPFIGYCYNNQPFYNTSTRGLVENAILHDSLYVSSVWKDETDYLHFMVTNDTGEERTLTVVTNLGETTYTIPRTYKSTEYEVDTKTFEDLPIDIEKVLEQTGINYVIFYENGRQIRFTNFDVYRVRRPSLV